MVKLSDDIGSFSPIDWSYSSCSVVSVLVKFRVSTGIAVLDLSSRSPCDPVVFLLLLLLWVEDPQDLVKLLLGDVLRRVVLAVDKVVDLLERGPVRAVRGPAAQHERVDAVGARGRLGERRPPPSTWVRSSGPVSPLYGSAPPEKTSQSRTP